MREGKLVRCKCHEPIGLSREACQPWADVWIRFTAKPGRKARGYGPTLIAMPSLLSDLECAERAGDQQEVAELKTIIALLEKWEVVIGNDWGYGTPSIYTRSDYINRQVAETMLREMMAWLGYKKARFKWERPKLVVCPV
jgi:hypothetical protein